MNTTPAWASHITATISTALRHWRTHRNLSAEQLSHRTNTLGYHVPRTVITNIELGRRTTVTVQELLILAAALDIPPTLLIAPIGTTSEHEILPGIHDEPNRLREWVHGRHSPNHPYHRTTTWADGLRLLNMYDLHRGLVTAYHHTADRLAEYEQLARTADAEKAHFYRERLAQVATLLAEDAFKIQRHRQKMTEARLPLPALPDAIIDAMTIYVDVEVPTDPPLPERGPHV